MGASGGDRPRNVFLTIGKENYNIKTPLEDDVLDRVRDLIDQACGAPVRGVGQEDLLVLTCLELAYALDTAVTGLADLLARLEPPEDPEPEDNEPGGEDEAEEDEAQTEDES